MNDVFVSGLISGDLVPVKNDGLSFSVSVSSGNSNYAPDEFLVVAYGNTAAAIKQRGAKSGDRIVLQGRLSSEKKDEVGEGGKNKYDTAITVNRMLSLGASENGVDYTYGVVSGEATTPGMVHTSSGSRVTGVNVKNVRQYLDSEKNEKEYTTYVRGSAWNKNADDLESSGILASGEGNIVMEGSLKSSTYTDKDGVELRKIDVWINEVLGVGSSASAQPKKSAPRKSQPKMKPADDLPF